MKRISRTGSASVYFLLSIAVIFAVGSFFVVRILRSDPIDQALGKKDLINILFVLEGTAEQIPGEEPRSEKPLGSYVLMYSPGNNRAAAISITGDIGLILKTVDRRDRIDAVYNPKNITPFITEIENLLEIKINYSLVFESEKLGKIVDLIEGVELFIPQPLKIYGESPVMFSSGAVLLDGDKAKQYIQFEMPEEDIAEAYLRRERFFLGFLKSLGEKNGLVNNPQVAGVFYPLIKTKMTRITREKLLKALSTLDMSRIGIQPVMGNYREVSGQKLLFPMYNGSVIKDITGQAERSLSQENPGAQIERIFTVEVLNGTVTTGLATRTAALIRGFRYNVIATGNAERNDYEKTEIIDRTGIENAAGVLAETINCKNIRYEEKNSGTGIPVSEYRADFTLIIGRDFNGRVVTGN